MLQETVIPISFAQGVDTKTDPKQVMAGKLLTLQNGVFVNPKEIIKRNGYSSLATTILTTTGSASITNGNSLGIYDTDLIEMDGNYLYSYMPDMTNWANLGVKMNTRISTEHLAGPTSPTMYATESIIGDTKFVGYGTQNSSTFITYNFLDAGTNTPLVSSNGFNSPSPTGVAQAVFSVAFNNDFVAIPTGFSSPNRISNILHCAVGTFNLINTGIVITQSPNYAPITAAVSPTLLYILYTDTSGNLTLQSYDTSYGLVNSAVVFPTMPAPAYRNGAQLIYDPVNNEVVVLYTNPGAVNGFCFFARYNGSTLALLTQHTLTATAGGQIVGVINGTSLIVFQEQIINIPAAPSNVLIVNRPLPNFRIIRTVVSAYRSTPVQVTLDVAGNVYLYSNPLLINGDVYLALIHNEQAQATQFIMRFAAAGDYEVVGKFSSGTAYSSDFISDNVLPLNIVHWANNSILPYLVESEIVNISTTLTNENVYVVKEVSLTFDEKLSNIELGENLNIQGGVVSVFDGNGIAESGFHLFPEIVSVTTSITNTPATFSYSYTAIYTWVDAAGNLHRSAPAVPVIVTTDVEIGGGSDSATVVVTSDGLSDIYKAQNVLVNVYRTTNQGTVYYLVGQIASENEGFNNVSITDTTFDSQQPAFDNDLGFLQANTQLYTTGGEVENISPPATNLMTEFKNRLIIVDAENPLQWWFSKQVIQGFPVEFSDVLVQNIDQKGGNISALSTMDDKLVFFKPSNIWYVIGDGPSANGQNNDFTYPQIISSDTGCVNQNSIVLSPQGLFFQSPKGIYLLGRDLSLNYIGAPVEAFNSDTVTSAQMIAGTNQIRFSLNTGVALVYDYFVSQWSVFTNIPALDAVIYNGNYSYLTSTGVINVETPGAYSDPGATPISLSLTTGWMSFAGLQNFQRVKQFLVLGESESPTTLSVSLAYNFNPTITQVDNIAMTGSQLPMQYRVFTQLQKCQTIQLTLSDSPTTTTEGLRLSALAFNIAQKKGPFKLPAAVTYG